MSGYYHQFEKKSRAHLPPWVVTFADLMTLLMCFFVLLLSYSELDSSKYRTLADSMRSALVTAGGTPHPPVSNSATVGVTEFSSGTSRPAVGATQPGFVKDADSSAREEYVARAEQLEKADANARRQRDRTANALGNEISTGLIELDLDDGRLVIRIRERGSFASGAADLELGFVPVITRIGTVLEGLEGEVSITGHTDNVPVNTRRYRSNWDLSAARAASVAHELFTASGLAPNRVVVIGRADTRPIADNDSDAGRARNRRIEVAVDLNR